jgi:hypothetical protein
LSAARAGSPSVRRCSSHSYDHGGIRRPWNIADHRGAKPPKNQQDVKPALACEPGGRTFESCRAHHHFQIHSRSPGFGHPYRVVIVRRWPSDSAWQGAWHPRLRGKSRGTACSATRLEAGGDLRTQVLVDEEAQTLKAGSENRRGAAPGSCDRPNIPVRPVP